VRKRPGHEARLDPVRWRRPGRGALARWAAVTLLLATAAIVLWSRPAPSPSSSGQRSLTEPGNAAAASPAVAGAGAPPGPPGSGGPAGTVGGPAGTVGGPAGTVGGPAGTVGGPAGTVGGPTGAVGGSAGPVGVPAGSVGVPVRLAEPTALRLLRPGDRVDLFRVGEPGAPVATAALVLEIAGVDDPTSGGLLLALTPAEAARTVTTAGHGYAVLIRPDG
jgi:hypothetical protein